jgi:hypothetical protein
LTFDAYRIPLAPPIVREVSLVGAGAVSVTSAVPIEDGGVTGGVVGWVVAGVGDASTGVCTPIWMPTLAQPDNNMAIKIVMKKIFVFMDTSLGLSILCRRSSLH